MKIHLPFLVRLLAFAWLFLGLTTLDASAQRSRKARKAKTEQQGRRKTAIRKQSARKAAKANKKRQPAEVAQAGKAARQREKSEKKAEPAGKKNDARPIQVSTPRKRVIDDRTVGKDDKGRPIYESPKGGRYYVNASGEKIYLSADKN